MPCVRAARCRSCPQLRSASPAMALRAGAFRHHAPHRARDETPPATPAALPPAHRCADCWRLSIHRPSGIRPPAAIAAATRAILNGDTSTSPCPYEANGSARRRFAGIAGGDAQLRRRIGQRLRPYVMHAQLREVRIAGNRDGALHVERAVRVVADVVFDGAVPAGDHCCPRGHRAACGTGYVRCCNCGIQIQRGNRRHQLERGARRILAVARAVEQFVRRRRGGARAGRIGRGHAHQRQHIARWRRPSPPPRPFAMPVSRR